MTDRISSPAHLRWLRTLPCIVTGSPVGVVVHHLQHAELSAMSRKSGDLWAVPVLNRLHCAQHTGSIHHSGDEAAWWLARGINPLPIAEMLWLASIASGRVRKDRCVAEAVRRTIGDVDSWIARGYHHLPRAAA